MKKNCVSMNIGDVEFDDATQRIAASSFITHAAKFRSTGMNHKIYTLDNIDG